MSAAPDAPSAPAVRVQRASSAVYAAFITCGFAVASWASRIPQVRDRFDLDPAQLGLLLLAIACGSLLALPLSGPVIARVGSRRTVRVMALMLGLALAVVAAGYALGIVAVVAGLFLVGFATGAWDVAMNVQGALVELRLGRSIMSRYHAGWSLGTVAGALLGAGAVAAHVSVSVHLLAGAAAIAVVAFTRVRHFIGDHEVDHGNQADDVGAAATSAAHAAAGPGGQGEPASPAVGHVGGPPGGRGALAAWLEPRTLLIGVVVLAFAFAEGAGNDWISVALIDGYGLPPALGTLAFATFLAAMTAARWFGPALLDRYGRVPVVRALAVVGIAGLLLFVFAPTAPLAFLGALLWGAGVSLGFPVGMSAGADQPALAAGRVSVIASIGYCAFLAGPPLIGLLGNSYTVLRALITVAVLLGLAALLTGVLRPPAQTPSPPHLDDADDPSR